ILSSVVADIAVHALGGITNALTCEDEPEHPNYTILLLRDAWPQLWWWLDLLYRRLVLVDHDLFEKEIADDFKEGLAVSIESILLNVSHHPLTSPVFAATKGALKLSAGIYIYLGLHPPKEHAGVRMKAAGETLSILIESSLPNFNEFIEAVGFDNRRAAFLLLQPLSLTIHGKESSAFFAYIFHVHFELCISHPTFYRSLPPKSVISNICAAMAYFISLAPSTEVHGCLSILLLTLAKYSSNVARGHSWLVYALRYNILSLVFHARRKYLRSGDALDASMHCIAPKRAKERTGELTEVYVDGVGQRILLASHHNLAFLHFLAEREMRLRRGQIMKSRDKLLAKSTSSPPPYVFLLDCTDSVPPVVSVQTVEEARGDRLTYIALPRTPVIVPLFRLRLGSDQRQILVSQDISGILFGWVDQQRK
ncbi:hypothetical protein DXG01_011661, partial [Tephrocybe rancida]